MSGTTFLKLAVVSVTMATVSRSCSPPEPGFEIKDPTPAQMFHYSAHVVVGKVMSRIYPDPRFGDMYGDGTYGALVKVRCSLKGPAMKSVIKVHGAGFIPGLCTAKPLEVGEEVILFLDKINKPTQTYEQVEIAAKYTTSQNMYRDVCDVTVRYPIGQASADINTCEAPDRGRACLKYNVKQDMDVTQPPSQIQPRKVDTTTPTVPTPKAGYSKNSSPDTRVSASVSGAIMVMYAAVMRLVR